MKILSTLTVLLRKLGTPEHNWFVDFILPKKTTDLGFSETIKLLLELFMPNTTLFQKLWKCLNKIEFLTSKNIFHADTLSLLIPKNTEVFEDSIIATLRTNLRNQKQCSQEKSSPSSINSFHGKQSSRKPSRPIRNISIQAIKFFSRHTKTT